MVRDYCSLRVHGSLLTERVGALDGNAGGEEIFAGPESDLLKAAERETDPVDSTVLSDTCYMSNEWDSCSGPFLK